MVRTILLHGIFDGLTRDTDDYDIDGFANDDEPDNRGELANSDVETDNHGIGASYITERGMIGFAYQSFRYQLWCAGCRRR